MALFQTNSLGETTYMKRSRNNSNPILICLLSVFFAAIGCSKKSTDTEIIYPAWQGTYIGEAHGSISSISGYSQTFWYHVTTKLWVTGSLPDSFLTVHLQFQKHDSGGTLRYSDYYWNGIVHGSETRIAGIYIDDDDNKHELGLYRSNPENISGSYKRFILMTDSSYFLEASISFAVK